MSSIPHMPPPPSITAAVTGGKPRSRHADLACLQPGSPPRPPGFEADLQVSSEDVARWLERTGEHRVLRRVPALSAPALPLPAAPGKRVGLVVDCETTGLDHAEAEIIEFGLVRFEYDENGVGRVLGTLSGLEQPTHPIPAAITEVTGISDDHVAGRFIDDRDVEAMTSTADLVIAHNAEFDRRFVERRWPTYRQFDWGCSLAQIAWRKEGYEARGLKSLLSEAGHFHLGHRALDDAAATLHLLTLPLPRSRRSGFEILLERVGTPSARIWAVGAPFEARDVLKRRGYRWSDGTRGMPRAWNVDLACSDAETELQFLAARVYRGKSHARAVTVEPRDRFTDRAGLP